MFFFLIFVLKFQLIFSFSFETAKNLHLFGFQNELSESELSFVELPRIRSKRFVDDFATIHFPVLLENETIVFQLKHKVLALDHVDSDECVLQGQSIRPNNSFSIALTGCGKDTQGLILTDKHFYVIRPSNFFNLINVTSDRSHVIQKRSTNQEVYSKCGVDHSDDPHPEDLIHHHISEEFAAVHKYSDLNIELGLFVDDAMWNFFIRFYGDDAEKQIKRFVIAAVNNIDILFSRSTMDPKVHLRITHFEIMKTSPMAMSRHHHNSGDVTKLLETFCTFQAGLNPVDDKDPKHWDHALLLTGYDIYRGNEKTVAGFAPVKGMCVDLKSCTVNEGLDFGTVFVIAHEMGHSLGMYHDGESNKCHSRCCIMSPSIGAGKTQWSDCSANELRVFVSKLGTTDRAHNCLADDPLEEKALPRIQKTLPGQQYTVDEQCSLFHGSCWKHELKDGQTIRDVCEMVWCSNGDGIVRTTHPALEGTFCGSGSVCIEGNCVPAHSHGIPLAPVDGHWSEWTEHGHCHRGCSECRIQGQLKVRNSLRKCSNPSPNNGGKQCPGFAVRGIVCDLAKCAGDSVDNFATKECTKFARDPMFMDLQLTGKGLQFEQASCKIWCNYGRSRDIQTMGDFPDGTPCGKDKFCVKGECLNLKCKKPTLVGNEQDCPVDEQFSEEKLDFDRNRGQPVNITALELSTWTEWEAWSQCVASKCGENGTMQRIRSCFIRGSNPQAESQLCAGARKQRSTCVSKC